VSSSRVRSAGEVDSGAFPAVLVVFLSAGG
jgi:hypothetical protein